MLKGSGFGTLGVWIASFKRLASKAEQRAMLEELQDESLELVQAGFNGRKDPYGVRWAKRKRPAAHPILEKSGKMRKGFYKARSKPGAILNRTKYAGYHQNGTERMVARPMLPDGRGIPRAWAKRYEKRIQRRMMSILRSK